MKNSQDNNRRMIQEAIRKIALGRSIERIEMARAAWAAWVPPA